MLTSDSVDIPMVEKSKLDEDLQGTPVDAKLYCGMIGSLMYLTSRTINMGLWYSKDTGMSLTAYADADHAGCQDTRRSTSGSAQFIGDNLVSWSFKKQKSTAISSTEDLQVVSEPPRGLYTRLNIDQNLLFHQIIMSAHDDFSLHDDEELTSLHDDDPWMNGNSKKARPKIGGNAISRKCKAVLKQLFEAFTISSKERLEIGCKSQFLRSLPRRAGQLAMTMRTEEDIDTLSIDDLYNNLSVFEQDIQKTSSSSLASDNVAFLSQAKASSSKHKPSHSTGSYIFLLPLLLKIKPNVLLGVQVQGLKKGRRLEAGNGQNFKPEQLERKPDDLDEVSMCSKLCLDSYNALQAKYDELQSEFGDQEAALVAHKLALSKDNGALKKNLSLVCISKNLWLLIDCGMSSTVKIGLGYGIQSNAEVLGYEEEISRGIFASRETDAGNYDIPLYSRFKQVEYKGVPHPLSGDYTPREQEDIDDSLYDDGEQGTVSDHSVNDEPIHIPSIEQVTIATQKTQPQVPKSHKCSDTTCRSL
ncbi:hypothetical protein Tco_0901192 [Tanacetum coccineum]